MIAILLCLVWGLLICAGVRSGSKRGRSPRPFGLSSRRLFLVNRVLR